jgi:hypothetical protein
MMITNLHTFYKFSLYRGYTIDDLAIDPEVLDLIPGATKFSERWWVWNAVRSTSLVQLRSYLEEKVSAPV